MGKRSFFKEESKKEQKSLETSTNLVPLRPKNYNYGFKGEIR